MHAARAIPLPATLPGGRVPRHAAGGSRGGMGTALAGQPQLQNQKCSHQHQHQRRGRGRRGVMVAAAGAAPGSVAEWIERNLDVGAVTSSSSQGGGAS